jgi:hypothetical protein
MFARTLRPALALLALSAGLGADLGQAEAGEYGRVPSYGTVYAPSYAYGSSGPSGGYGFADEAVRGAYIGAPLTRFPRPSEIVPPAWSYGTYGIPTVAGIARAPVGQPTLTVIDTPSPPPRRRSGARILSRGESGHWTRMDAPAADATGSRIIAVRVPRG